MVAAAKVFLWFILYSFFGWVYESILCSCTSHSLVNRGFLNGPLCPIYGFGAVTVILAFWWEPDISLWNLFLSSMVLTCTLEYITSWGMEKLFHARWWDYSDYRFQLNGRVCLLGAVAFGSFSVLLIKVVHPRVAALVNRLPPPGRPGRRRPLLRRRRPGLLRHRPAYPGPQWPPGRDPAGH